MSKELEGKREVLVNRMLVVRSLRRGTLGQQSIERTRNGGPSGEVRGPY
jgi:hypothetical protein